MPVKNALSDEGLTWDEIVAIQEFLNSFQSGMCTKEDTILRIVNFLNDRKSMDVKVWEDLKDTFEMTGFDWNDIKEFVHCVREDYQKKKRSLRS